MAQTDICPICGAGQVTAQVETEYLEYKGQTSLLPLHFANCDHCQSDFAGSYESKRNKRVAIAFHKEVDCLLTGAEICAIRSQYKITQNQAARLFGGGPVAFSKYENDDVAQSEAMDNLLRLVRRSTDAFWCLVEEKQMQTEIEKPKLQATAA